MKKLKLTFQALTILLDASGLLLSLFSIESIDNTRLKLIVHLCQAFRTELIILMILLFCGFYFIPFAYRHFRTADTFNRLICISSILTAAVLFSPYAVKYAKHAITTSTIIYLNRMPNLAQLKKESTY